MGISKLVLGPVKMAIALVMAIPITLFFFLLSFFYLKDLSSLKNSSADFVKAALGNNGNRLEIYISSTSMEKRLMERNPGTKPGWYPAGKLNPETAKRMGADLINFLVESGGEIRLQMYPITRIIYYDDDSEKYLVTVNRAAGLSISAVKYDDISEKLKKDLEGE